jgi:hypothetical protein
MRVDGYLEAFEKTICCEKCGEPLLTVKVKKEMDNFGNKIDLSAEIVCFACREQFLVSIDEKF